MVLWRAQPEIHLEQLLCAEAKKQHFMRIQGDMLQVCALLFGYVLIRSRVPAQPFVGRQESSRKYAASIASSFTHTSRRADDVPPCSTSSRIGPRAKVQLSPARGYVVEEVGWEALQHECM